MVARMEVTPIIRVPYGLVHRKKIVGVIYLNDDYRQVAYVTTDPLRQFGFCGESEVAAWLTGFWEASRSGKVVDVSERMCGPSLRCVQREQGDDVWLEFRQQDGRRPAFSESEPYGLWNPRTRDFPRPRNDSGAGMKQIGRDFWANSRW